MTYTFAFNSRETYLEYKEEWKQRYFERSKKQRELKMLIRDMMRKGGMIMASQYQYALLKGAIEANSLLAERKASKIEANRQWRAVHLQKA